MINNIGKRVAILVLVVGLIALAVGGVFITLGFQKANLITTSMAAQNVSYAGAGGDILGIIDTPQEAQVMATILEQHRSERYGSYTSLGKDDPNRQTILNAMTMENSLNMAVLGYGLTDVVKASGAFMVLVGLAFVAISVPGILQRKPVS